MKISDYIIFQNDDLVAVNKPSRLLSIPDREGREESLKSLLLTSHPQIFTVHRLDKDTSGLILFAKNEAAHRYLSMLFEERKVEKWYLGLVLGSPLDKEGTIQKPISENQARPGSMIIHTRGKESVTDYEVLENFGQYSWLQFRIHTGRTHQIRVHMKDAGHPIACDDLYGDGKPLYVSAMKNKFKLSKKEEAERPILNRLALHASRLSLEWMDGQPINLEAELPKDLRATLQQLNRWKKEGSRQDQ